MARLPHGYTNRTRRVGARVEKTYVGAARFERARREQACLTSIRDRLPVPTVVDADRSIPRLTVRALPGDHGQDLIDDGHARAVLRLVGATWRALQEVPVTVVHDLAGDGSFVVHGDFGPQNLLVDLDADRVTGVLDWEFAHLGEGVEDLAWAEWIVRMHHPRAVGELDALFVGAGARPSWSRRHDEMLRRVRELVADAERTMSPSPWRHRLELTEGWSE